MVEDLQGVLCIFSSIHKVVFDIQQKKQSCDSLYVKKERRHKKIIDSFLDEVSLNHLKTAFVIEIPRIFPRTNKTKNSSSCPFHKQHHTKNATVYIFLMAELTFILVRLCSSCIPPYSQTFECAAILICLSYVFDAKFFSCLKVCIQAQGRPLLEAQEIAQIIHEDVGFKNV